MSASAAPGDIRTPSVLLDNSFEVFIQRASGLGDSLEIDVDHEVLQQVVNDSGLAEVMVSFEADETGNAAHLTVLSEASACFTVSAIKKKSRRLKSKESSQKVIQEGIVIGLAKLASQDPEADDQTLKGKLGSFAAKRVQRTAKVIGGYAGGFLASVSCFKRLLSIVLTRSRLAQRLHFL